MKEKIALAVVSALLGGALGNIAEAMQTKGRLDSIERAIVRIEARLYPAAPGDRN